MMQSALAWKDHIHGKERMKETKYLINLVEMIQLTDNSFSVLLICISYYQYIILLFSRTEILIATILSLIRHEQCRLDVVFGEMTFFHKIVDLFRNYW